MGVLAHGYVSIKLSLVSDSQGRMGLSDLTYAALTLPQPGHSITRTPVTKYSVLPKQEEGIHLCWS
jgi:hypothetical protein